MTRAVSLVTAEQIVALYDCPPARAAQFAPHLEAAMWCGGIVTPSRIRAFLAQIGHESARLRHVRELWGPTDAQRTYERDPGEPWARLVDGRRHRNTKPFDLGNSEPGDGRRYLGRGLIQITGRANYRAVSDALEQDFVSFPGLLESHRWAALSAAWYWQSRGLNALADEGDFDLITRRINGGQTGRADRVALHEAAAALIA